MLDRIEAALLVDIHATSARKGKSKLSCVTSSYHACLFYQVVNHVVKSL